MPNCIEPSHLSVGSQIDNIFDMYEKDLAVVLRGRERTSAKLKEEDVVVVRGRLANGDTCAEIARSYNVSEGLIRHIKKGRAWRHVS